MKSRLLQIGLFLCSFVLQGQAVKEIKLSTPTNLATPSNDQIARDRVSMGTSFRSQGTQGRLYAGTDANLMTPVDYTATDANGAPIYSTFDSNLPVGSIAGSASATPLGDANYNIPIELPAGIAGMQPSLSINYNSNAGDGILGMNWILTGLSEIQRTAVKRYYNGVEAAGVIYDNSDMFVLDGEVLVPLEQNGTFRKTNEDFSKVETYEYGFRISTKDGKVIDYGSNANSQVLYNNNQLKCLIYKINRVTDLNGNYIQYNYINYGNEHLIKSIEYTGNVLSSVQPISRVEFIYEDRKDTVTRYRYGVTMKCGKILTKITSFVNSNLYREYTLKYFFKEKTLLQQISLKGADGIALNPVKIYWNESGPIQKNLKTNYEHVGNATTPFVKKVFGDFNGDGTTDYLSIHSDGAYWNVGSQSYKIATFTNCWDAYVVDVDKDGKDELYFHRKVDGVITYENYRWTGQYS
ncbi:MAG TPA: SpvB/TcaC N-terminal domain-containing protein, partial [Cytophagales bacterium]|nr:SpvB/TcaC N-terminal domain-containing protein [Cytophagales bacterium]